MITIRLTDLWIYMENLHVHLLGLINAVLNECILVTFEGCDMFTTMVGKDVSLPTVAIMLSTSLKYVR